MAASYAVATARLCMLLFFSLERSVFAYERYAEMTLYTGDIAGQKRTDVSTVSTGGPTWFGSIHTRDAPLADGPGSNARVVGRAMDVGFKVTAETENTWYTYMIFLFKNGSRFNGSTLQIGGLNTPTDAEWAILGGTGNLTMARGIVRRNLTRNYGFTQYKVYAYYTPMPFVGASGHELHPNM